MRTLQLPTNENILLSAYRAVAERSITNAAELEAEYRQHFTTTVPVVQSQVFEKFSIIDPTIHMTVQSSTSTT